jgi:hypothetical protein
VAGRSAPGGLTALRAARWPARLGGLCVYRFIVYDYTPDRSGAEPERVYTRVSTHEQQTLGLQTGAMVRVTLAGTTPTLPLDNNSTVHPAPPTEVIGKVPCDPTPPPTPPVIPARLDRMAARRSLDNRGPFPAAGGGEWQVIPINGRHGSTGTSPR